jgi:2-polyprenyl-6-methoxyphenol hydroxylase-like FAD-dependent oxidoreductase
MTLSLDECDLLVVGGGPSGSTAGTFVARAGHKVILLEREVWKSEWMSKEFRERCASPIDEKDPALAALRASGKAVVEEAFKGSTARRPSS